MTNPWTDPITGATVTAGTNIITIAVEGRSNTYIHGDWVGTKHAAIVERWKAARDE